MVIKKPAQFRPGQSQRNTRIGSWAKRDRSWDEGSYHSEALSQSKYIVAKSNPLKHGKHLRWNRVSCSLVVHPPWSLTEARVCCLGGSVSRVFDGKFDGHQVCRQTKVQMKWYACRKLNIHKKT